MKNYRRTISLFTAFAICICLLSGYTSVVFAETAGDFTVTTTSSGYSYDSENHKLIISDGGEYEITGTTTTDRIIIESEDDVTLTLNNVNIASSVDSPLRADKGNLTLILKGDNSLATTATNYPGLTKESSDYTLTITSYRGDGNSAGSLSSTGAENAAGIGGGNYNHGLNITINGGTVTATGGNNGAGIGGGSAIVLIGGRGSVTINGGTVTATGNGYGAGIGGGYCGNGTVTITGGTVTASSQSGAGIGSGSNSDNGSVNISGGMISASSDYGNALGNGYTNRASTPVTITGGYFADSGYTAGTYGTGKVYSCDIADGYEVYTNASSQTYQCVVGHIHETYDTDGFCIGCDSGYEPATLNTDGVYEITNAGELFWFASLVSGDVIQDGITAADTAANAILTTDIDLDSKEWTPIGTKAVPYTGVFDGNGYEISGLSITTEAEYIGLFGYVKEGTVENLTVSGAIDVSGDTIFAGGIVGTIYNGTLSNLTSYVDVMGETATKGTFGGVAATVEGTDKTAGSTMENCANYGDVTPSGVLDCTGGLVGYMNSATINNCANYGKVDTIGATAQQNEGVYAAGIVSYINNSTAVITNCINVGTISGAAESEDYDRYTGAIVGRIKNNVGEITNVYYLDTSAEDGCTANASGIELDITAKTADELASGAVTYLLQNGAGDSVWGQDLDSDVYPTLHKTNVVKLTFVGDSTIERYANVGIVPTNYPTPATGIYAFYTDSDMTNRIDTSSYTYTTDATVYMAQMYTITQNLTNITSDNTATEIVPGSEFTANLTVAYGYFIKSVTVTMGNSDITNTAYSNGTISISNVSGDIIITAIVEVQKVSVTQNLTNVTSDNTATEAAVNREFIANLKAASGYVIESVTVTMGGTNITSAAYLDGTVNITSVTDDIVITAVAVEIYTVTQNLTNVTSDNTATDAVVGSTYTANLTVADGYAIKNIIVTMGNTDITDTAYANGTVTISNVTGNIVITATAVAADEKIIMINGVTINSDSVDVDITNTLGASGVVIVAAYDTNGALLDFAAADLADGTVNIDIDTTGAATVSAFIWDSTSTMAPLCNKYTAAV